MRTIDFVMKSGRVAKQDGEMTEPFTYPAAFLGAPESHVIVYCPSPKMSLKEADVPVEIAAGRVQTLDSLGHPDVSGLQEKHAGIWRFVVCVRREHLARRAALAEKCAEIIGFAPPA